MRRVLIALVLLMFMAGGCGIYTFSPSALGGLKKIAIPVFSNNTAEYGLEDLITSQLSQAFVNDNTLKVVTEDKADAILYGEITTYAHDPYTYTETETVNEYKCQITLKIRIQFVDSDKILWQDDNLSEYGIYSIIDGQNQDDGDQIAVGKLTDEIINRTVKGW
jgi:hypothetical protein